jgi:AraC-like DNA-binding protein
MKMQFVIDVGLGEIPNAFSSSSQGHTTALVNIRETYHKGIVKNIFQTIPKSHLSMGTVFKELQVIRTSFQRKFDAVLEIVLGKVNVVYQVGKAYFRFDHPELCQVTTSVRIFCTESWTESVHI